MKLTPRSAFTLVAVLVGLTLAASVNYARAESVTLQRVDRYASPMLIDLLWWIRGGEMGKIGCQCLECSGAPGGSGGIVGARPTQQR